MSLGMFMEDDTIGMVSYMVGFDGKWKMETEEQVKRAGAPRANGTVADIPPGTMSTRKHSFQFLVSTKIRLNHSYNN